MICSRTSASNDESSKPSARGSMYASSRFGPIVPLVPASASVWQPPQVVMNSFLPFARSAPP